VCQSEAISEPDVNDDGDIRTVPSSDRLQLHVKLTIIRRATTFRNLVTTPTRA